MPPKGSRRIVKASLKQPCGPLFGGSTMNTDGDASKDDVGGAKPGSTLFTFGGHEPDATLEALPTDDELLDWARAVLRAL